LKFLERFSKRIFQLIEFKQQRLVGRPDVFDFTPLVFLAWLWYVLASSLFPLGAYVAEVWAAHGRLPTIEADASALLSLFFVVVAITISRSRLQGFRTIGTDMRPRMLVVLLLPILLLFFAATLIYLFVSSPFVLVWQCAGGMALNVLALYHVYCDKSVDKLCVIVFV
jgi:hypothetical protein